MIIKFFARAARLWLLGAAAATGFAAIAGEAAAQIPPAPLGLDRDGTIYALLSNSRWFVSENGGGFQLAKVGVIPVRTGNPDAISAFDRQDHAYIWAGRCTASRQVLIFRRDYYLPGPPKAFEAGFTTRP